MRAGFSIVLFGHHKYRSLRQSNGLPIDRLERQVPKAKHDVAAPQGEGLDQRFLVAKGEVLQPAHTTQRI